MCKKQDPGAKPDKPDDAGVPPIPTAVGAGFLAARYLMKKRKKVSPKAKASAKKRPTSRPGLG